MDAQFTKLQLSNGLTVLLKEIHTAPIVSVWMWYRVGSRNERAGLTGISHWTEHMQFKGTPRFPSDVLDKAVAREGGYRNAFTFLDWTTYFETLPADKCDLALELEADRMHNSLFDPAEVELERTVIISEREGNENEPMFLLSEEVQAAAFRIHPYHHEIIGDMVDLHSMTRDDLYRHYKAHYVPSNAVLAIAGDFEMESMLARVRELYEPLPDGDQPDRTVRPEPNQSGERRGLWKALGNHLCAGCLPVAGCHPSRFPGLPGDGQLLTGPSNLNMFGAGISTRPPPVPSPGREGTGGECLRRTFSHDRSIFTRHRGHGAPQSSPERVIRHWTMKSSAFKMKPSVAELERAVKQARALFAYGSESITNQAFWLGYSEMFDTYDWFIAYLDRLASVTPDDVQRIAQTYLRPQNRVMGVYLPTGSGVHTGREG
jgi:zinc protease